MIQTTDKMSPLCSEDIPELLQMDQWPQIFDPQVEQKKNIAKVTRKLILDT